MTGSLVHDHLQSIHVANKIYLSYVTNIPKVMGLACGTFVTRYLKTLDMPCLSLFFSKTEDRNQWHRDPEAVYNTLRFQNVSTKKYGIPTLHEIQKC